MTHLFDSPPPRHKLASTDNGEDWAMNDKNFDWNRDSTPPSIISSIFNSEDVVEEDAGQEEHTLPDGANPSQEEAPSGGASPAQTINSLHLADEGSGEALQYRFRVILRDGEGWITVEEYSFATSLPSLVEVTAEKNAGEGQLLFDIRLWSLHPSQCF